MKKASIVLLLCLIIIPFSVDAATFPQIVSVNGEMSAVDFIAEY